MDETISFQLLSNKDNITIDRLHICTWELGSNKPIVEIGLDINKNSLVNLQELDFTLYTSWQIDQSEDLFTEIKKEENARFIFNESIKKHLNLNENSNFGVLHSFTNDTNLCILPVKIKCTNKLVNISINLQYYKNDHIEDNIYIRFYIIPKVDNISIQKKGIAKSTIIYDTKINEKRNIPNDLLDEISNLKYPIIKSCYNFNIVQNNMDISFEDKHLKSVRNLEYKSFKDYFEKLIENKKIKIGNKELLVVFSKNKENDSTYSFFTIYTKEHFGLKQISIVLILNLICSFLFFLPSYRGMKYNHNDKIINNILCLPMELLIIFFIVIGSIVYIWNPKNIFRR